MRCNGRDRRLDAGSQYGRTGGRRHVCRCIRQRRCQMHANYRTRSATLRATADQCGVAWTNPTESIVVDLAENVSSRKLIAIKALNTATSYSAGLRTQSNSMLLNGRHLIG